MNGGLDRQDKLRIILNSINAAIHNSAETISIKGKTHSLQSYKIF